MRYAMVMAGGAGTRLWPMSRAGEPKQLIPFIQRPGNGAGGAVSLLEVAVGRLGALVPEARRYICTAERYRGLIRARMPGFSDARILGEPAARDTVNAVGFAAAVFEKLDPDAVFCVLTADHIIEPEGDFAEAMELGFRLVEADRSRLVTFAITPTEPATGFGYVRRGAALPGFGPLRTGGGAFVVRQFVEKPDLPTATRYVESGEYGWNSGMFVFSARTVMECLERFKPESYAGLRRIQQVWGGPDAGAVLAEVYPALPKISVDYAMMEPASRDERVTVCGVDMAVRWLDIGSWPSYAETIAPDAEGNRVAGSGELHAVASRGNLVVSGGSSRHTIALLGCDDLIVVHTDDATLIMPRARAQELKELHARVPDDLK